MANEQFAKRMAIPLFHKTFNSPSPMMFVKNIEPGGYPPESLAKKSISSVFVLPLLAFPVVFAIPFHFFG